MEVGTHTHRNGHNKKPTATIHKEPRSGSIMKRARARSFLISISPGCLSDFFFFILAVYIYIQYSLKEEAEGGPRVTWNLLLRWRASWNEPGANGRSQGWPSLFARYTKTELGRTKHESEWCVGVTGAADMRHYWRKLLFFQKQCNKTSFFLPNYAKGRRQLQRIL